VRVNRAAVEMTKKKIASFDLKRSSRSWRRVMILRSLAYECRRDDGGESGFTRSLAG
jgi:hypothetical protein